MESPTVISATVIHRKPFSGLRLEISNSSRTRTFGMELGENLLESVLGKDRDKESLEKDIEKSAIQMRSL